MSKGAVSQNVTCTATKSCTLYQNCGTCGYQSRTGSQSSSSGSKTQTRTATCSGSGSGRYWSYGGWTDSTTCSASSGWGTCTSSAGWGSCSKSSCSNGYTCSNGTCCNWSNYSATSCPSNCNCYSSTCGGSTKYSPPYSAKTGYQLNSNYTCTACTWSGYTATSCPSNCNCYSSTCGGSTKYSAPYGAKSGYQLNSNGTCTAKPACTKTCSGDYKLNSSSCTCVKVSCVYASYAGTDQYGKCAGLLDECNRLDTSCLKACGSNYTCRGDCSRFASTQCADCGSDNYCHRSSYSAPH